MPPETPLAAHDHLAASARLLDLPGAAAVGAGTSRVAPAAAFKPISSTAVVAEPRAPPATAAASEAVGSLLVGALRTGTGLEVKLADRGRDDEGDSEARKRPRT